MRAIFTKVVLRGKYLCRKPNTIFASNPSACCLSAFLNDEHKCRLVTENVHNEQHMEIRLCAQAWNRVPRASEPVSSKVFLPCNNTKSCLFYEINRIHMAILTKSHCFQVSDPCLELRPSLNLPFTLKGKTDHYSKSY